MIQNTEPQILWEVEEALILNEIIEDITLHNGRDVLIWNVSKKVYSVANG